MVHFLLIGLAACVGMIGANLGIVVVVIAVANKDDEPEEPRQPPKRGKSVPALKPATAFNPA